MTILVNKMITKIIGELNSGIVSTTHSDFFSLSFSLAESPYITGQLHGGVGLDGKRSSRVLYGNSFCMA